MRGRVVSPVIRRPALSAPSTGQRDGFGYFVSSPADGYDSVIAKVRPDFVGVGKIERLARISSESLDLLNHLTRTQIHDYKTPIGLARNEQALAFDIYSDVIHVAFRWQRD